MSSIEQLVCKITAKYWRSNKSVLIACENEQQAVRLDEALWIKPSEVFIPHDIIREKSKNKASPVELLWLREYFIINLHDVLINLNTRFVDFTISFTEVVDFIPYEEPLKEMARKRYRNYRAAGFNYNMAIWNNNNEENI